MGRTQRPRHPALIELGKRARARRLDLGLSQMGLGEKAEMHFSYIADIERGERNLSVASLLRLCEGLALNPAELVDSLRWSQPVKRPRGRPPKQPE